MKIKEIFLIDDSKIIKRKIHLLKSKVSHSKDGIEEEFLLNSGIADLSVDSFGRNPKIYFEKYEQRKSNKWNEWQ